MKIYQIVFHLKVDFQLRKMFWDKVILHHTQMRESEKMTIIKKIIGKKRDILFNMVVSTFFRKVENYYILFLKTCLVFKYEMIWQKLGPIRREKIWHETKMGSKEI